MENRRTDGPQPGISRWGQLWRLLGMLAISLVGLSGGVIAGQRETPVAIVLELLGGVLAYLVVWWRRRAPMAVFLIVMVLAVSSGIAAGPAVLATVSIATRRITSELVVVAVLSFGSTQAYAVLTPTTADPWWFTLGANVLVTTAVVAWGMFVGSRRELLWTLRQRAERAEAEQELRVDHARVGERAAIAREMHDVLAHRISQISMHAGALAIREDLDAPELRAGASLVQARANEALADLRDVLGVLRDTETGERVPRPQPTYADLGELLDRAREEGASIVLDDGIRDTDDLPPVVGRTLYRIVQEGLTNAAKHARGARVSVTLRGDAVRGVTVEVSNPRPVGATRPVAPGSGLGLLGLSERAELRGGLLTHQDDGNQFVLRGWIPWTP